MVSVILTTYKETRTLPKALDLIIKENIADEILVVAPDEETEKLVKEKYPMVVFLKNKKITKPAALNLGFSEAKGDLAILTDGDVFIEQGGLKRLLKPFVDPLVGLVCGQPIPLNSKGNLFGFWAHFLCFAAHQMRSKNKIFPCSGNLYAIRKNLFSLIPENTMVDDALISQMVLEKNSEIAYIPQARVFVKYPTNFKDWLGQKIRATGGYVEKCQMSNAKCQIKKMRNFWQTGNN